MIKILFNISTNIELEYLESLKEIINIIKTEIKDIEFKIFNHEFSKLEQTQITGNRDAFLNSKFSELNDDIFNAVIYISDSSLNLKDNYLWFSIGGPESHVMIISSFLFKQLIRGKLDFGSYVFILYSQFLARFTVKLENPHYVSKNCLNDTCGEQIELLNVLKNEKDVLCDTCLSKIKNKKYHNLTKKIIDIVKNHPQKKIIKEEEIKSDTVIVRNKESKVRMVPDKGCWYEFEIYMAKKCSNLSKLYKELDKLLSNYNSKITGYSLYEVSGGWRGEIKGIGKNDWKKLNDLRKELENKEDAKDLIRPLKGEENKKYAVFDEASTVLRIIVNLEDYEDNIFDDASCPIIREINEIFEEVTEKEQSVLFTLKKLHGKGSILIKGKK